MLTEMEASVGSSIQHSRIQMANRYNKRFQIESFEVNAIVSLHIPRQDRGTLDYPRLYARILAQPHPGRYQLQTQYGILDRLYPTAELNSVPPLVVTTLDLGNNTTAISLHQAAALASQVTELLLYCSCKQETSCKTKRCKCFKSGYKYTNYCHQGSKEPDSCLNLALPENRNTRILIPRIQTPIPSSSIISTTNLSDSDSSTTQGRKRRASRLSASEGSIHTLRSTRSKPPPIASNISEPMASNISELEDISDTIIVRKE
ncbi:hypothetical protein EV426DRAFT_176299 [Tirmania nivea]|nr:hypothetical protein EV426DRAFT_176299 [Tirmania nivea]